MIGQTTQVQYRGKKYTLRTIHIWSDVKNNEFDNTVCIAPQKLRQALETAAGDLRDQAAQQIDNMICYYVEDDEFEMWSDKDIAKKSLDMPFEVVTYNKTQVGETDR
jgi:ABC-type histidine transport system ATPase subunit